MREKSTNFFPQVSKDGKEENMHQESLEGKQLEVTV